MVISLERGADLHTAQLLPLPLPSLASVKSRLVLPFSYRLTRVVLDKGPLNGCVCVYCYTKNMDNYHLSQIITWWQLNRASLSVTQQMLVVIKHGVDVYFFINAAYQCTANGACITVQLSSAKLYFFCNHDPSSPKMNVTDYSKRFMESCSIINMSVSQQYCRNQAATGWTPANNNC